MSWERAELHSCSDGRPCRGHMVNTYYEKDKATGQTFRKNYCNRCSQQCSTEFIPNQNYRDMTGRGSCVTRKKKEVVEPEYRYPDGEFKGMTIKEMKEDSARQIKEDRKKMQEKLRKENLEFIDKLVKSGMTREEIKTIMMSGIKEE